MIKGILLILVVAISQQAVAGKYAAEFLNTGIGARALGMGGAYVALADDGSAGYWNPAGLMQVPRMEVAFMHAARFSGLQQSDVLHFVKPAKNYAVGLTYLRMGISDIPYTSKRDLNNRPVIDRYVSDVEDALYFSVAKTVRPGLSIGGNLKALRQRVGDNSALGFGLDLGLLYRPLPQWTLGLALQDISGTYVYWDSGHHDVKSPAINFGASWKKSLLFLRSFFVLSVQQVIRFEGESIDSAFNVGPFANSDVSIGGEYVLHQLLACRLGSDAGNLTAGAGIYLKRIRLDYAFMTHDLGNAHRVAVTVGF